MELTQLTNVTFNEGYHKYLTDDFTELSGVTSIIKQCICPELYSDIDPQVLAKAAAHGTLCHKLCEAFDEAHLNLEDNEQYSALAPISRYEGAEEITLYNQGALIQDVELYDYINLIKTHKLNIIASEYLVSDGKNFASQIDKVARISDDEFAIIDLKFTYAYHEEPVTWQTSIYADMFEKQNEGAKVKKLYCIHIHKYKDGTRKADLHELKRIHSDLIEEVKRCYLTGTPFDNPLRKKEIKLADLSLNIDGEELSADMIAEIIAYDKEVSAKKKKITDAIKSWFSEHPDCNKLKLPQFSASQSSSSTSYCFDEARLKAEQPELYASYCTGIKTTAPRTTISLTKSKK